MAAAVGTVAGWTLASPTSLGEVAPAVGTVADGNVAILVDAPAASTGKTVLRTKVTVTPGSTYEFGGSFRSLTSTLPAGGLTVEIGDATVSVPALPAQANWQHVEGTYTAPAGTTEVDVTVTLNTAVRRVAIDNLSLTDAAGTEMLPNPSFEEVSKATLLANSSLTMSTQYATLAVSAPAGDVSYTLKRPNGTVALEGKAPVTGSLAGIPLTGITQGYYDLVVTDADDRSASASIGVVDTAGYDIPLDVRYGTTVHVNDSHYNGQVRYAATLGLGMVGSDVLWRLNETTKGQYDWDKRYDNAFARLRASGVELGATINYGNALWGDAKVPQSDAAIAAYGRYAAAVAERYHPAAMEIFNEFNHTRFNKTGCGTSADCYLPLVKSVSTNVRTVDPEITLVAGATANYFSDWFDRLWKLGGEDYIDAMSFHPYSANSRPDKVSTLIADAQKVSAKYADSAMPIWITETGSSSKTGGKTLPGQGNFLMAMESSQLAAGVARLRWYDMKNGSNDPTDHERNFGLFEFEPRKNTAALSLKPSGYAQALLVAATTDREAAGSINAGSGVVAHVFGKDADRSFVVWTPDGSATTASIPSSVALTVAGVTGQQTVIQPVGGVVTINITKDPVLLTPTPGDATDASPSPTPTASPAS